MRDVYLDRLPFEGEAASHERATVSNELEVTTLVARGVATCPQNFSHVLALIAEKVEIIGKPMTQVNSTQRGSSREATG